MVKRFSQVPIGIKFVFQGTEYKKIDEGHGEIIRNNKLTGKRQEFGFSTRVEVIEKDYYSDD